MKRRSTNNNCDIPGGQSNIGKSDAPIDKAQLSSSSERRNREERTTNVTNPHLHTKQKDKTMDSGIPHIQSIKNNLNPAMKAVANEASQLSTPHDAIGRHAGVSRASGADDLNTPSLLTMEQLRASASHAQITSQHQQYASLSTRSLSGNPQLESAMYANSVPSFVGVNTDIIHQGGTLNERFLQSLGQQPIPSQVPYPSLSRSEISLNRAYPPLYGAAIFPQRYPQPLCTALPPFLSSMPTTQRSMIGGHPHINLDQHQGTYLQNYGVINNPHAPITQSLMNPGVTGLSLPSQHPVNYSSMLGFAGLSPVQQQMQSLYSAPYNPYIQQQSPSGVHVNRNENMSRSDVAIPPPTTTYTAPLKIPTTEDILDVHERPLQRRRLNHDVVDHTSHQQRLLDGKTAVLTSESPSGSLSCNQQEPAANQEGKTGRSNSVPRVFKSFEDRFQDLLLFKEKHGHCNVPRRYNLDKSLGVWCNNIRFSYKQINEGKQPHNSLTKADIRRLESVGFNWKLINKKKGAHKKTKN